MPCTSTVRPRSATRRALALAAVAAFALAGTARAQTAEEIIAKNIKATGGEEVIMKITSLQRESKMVSDGKSGHMVITQSMKFIPGKRAYTSMIFEGGSSTSAWPGGDLIWTGSPELGFQEYGGPEMQMQFKELSESKYLDKKNRDQMAQMLRDMPKSKKLMVRGMKDQSQVNMLMAYRDNGSKVTRLGDEMAARLAPKGNANSATSGRSGESVDCYVLEIEPPDGSPKVRVLIDKKTDLIFQTRSKVQMKPNEETEWVSENTEYEEVSGVRLPKTVTGVSGADHSVASYTKTIINAPIDEKIFEMPKGKAKGNPAAGATAGGSRQPASVPGRTTLPAGAGGKAR